VLSRWKVEGENAPLALHARFLELKEVRPRPVQRATLAPMPEGFIPARWERLMGWAERSQALPRREEYLRCALHEAMKPGGREYVPTTLVYFGHAFLEAGHLPRARAAYDRAVEALIGVEGREGFGIPGLLSYVAEAAEQAGDIAAARHAYREALRVLENMPPEPRHVACMANLAHLLKQEQPAEAESLYQKALEISEQVHGVEHVETATTAHSLALHLASQQQYPRALELLKRVIDIYTTSQWYPAAAITLREVAGVLARAGRFDDAERALRQSKEMFDAAHKQRNAGGHELLNGVQATTWIECEADLLRDKGQHAESEALYRKALGDFTRLCGKNSPNLISTLAGYARLLHEMGRAQDAAVQELEADRLREKAHMQRCPGCGQESPRTATQCEHCKRLFTQVPPIEPAPPEMMARIGFPDMSGLTVYESEEPAPSPGPGLGTYIVYGLFFGILGFIGYLVWYAYVSLEWEKFQFLMLFLISVSAYGILKAYLKHR
jgi:tetratricopeptide (TPR) repeat protein